MEKAFHDLGREQLAETEHLHGFAWKLLHTYGLRPGLLAMSHVWQAADGRQEFVIAAKGAPEAIADLCHLDAADRAALTQSVDAMAAEGLRVLGVARASFAGQVWPDSQHDFAFSFLGLVGLADPLRASVPDAVSECRSAGIKVVMITGDYPATARAIARQAGLDAEDLVTGEELDQLSEAALAQRVRTATVFARIMPEQKLRIVNALKANGEIVAMTGDGVNDAPSLKAAHIGIAMGGRGTDVAREASSIVLLDDDFGSIVKSVQLGRPNLRQPSQSNGLHIRCACAYRRTGPATAAVWLAYPIWAHAHRIFADGDRSGVFAGVRGRDGGGRCDAPTAACARCAPVFRPVDRLESPARSVRVCARCRHLRRRVQTGYAGGGSACAGFLFVDPDDCQPDLCQPLLQCVAGYGSAPAESGACLGPPCRHDDVGPDASLAVCKRSLPVRTSALERSRADAGCRRSCACFPRGSEASVRGMAAKPISARRCVGSAAMMCTRLCLPMAQSGRGDDTL